MIFDGNFEIYSDSKYCQASLSIHWSQNHWTVRLKLWFASYLVIKDNLCLFGLRYDLSIRFYNNRFYFLLALICEDNTIVFIQVWDPSKLYDHNIFRYEHYFLDICFFVLPVIISEQESLATFKNWSKVEEFFIWKNRRFGILIFLNFCFDILIIVLFFQNCNHCLCSPDFLIS